MVTEELAVALRPFFEDWRGPEGYKIEELFARLDVDHLDPDGDSDRRHSKATRVERVLVRAVAESPPIAWTVFGGLVELIRSQGGFRRSSEHYPGQQAVATVGAVLGRQGYEIDDEGILRATVFDRFDETETAAGIRSVVARARKGSEDPPLVIASAKEVVEASARYVIQAFGDSYSPKDSFAKTLGLAFEKLAFSTARFDRKTEQYELSGDEWHRVTQALYVLGCEVSRFRNEYGLGHGRPEETMVTSTQADLAAECAGAIATVLLNTLERALP